MSKFKVGDEVRIIKLAEGESEEYRKYVGRNAHVVEISVTGRYALLLEGNKYNWLEEELELAEACAQTYVNNTKNKKPFMKTLSNTIKKYVSKDLQSQLKANFRNGDLALTQEGKDELLEILAEEHKVELTKRANEEIADEKDNA